MRSVVGASLSTEQRALRDLWDAHVRAEFVTHEPEAALANMTDDATVDLLPVLGGGAGKEELREFYGRRLIPELPADTEIVALSRTIGEDRLVDELVFRFTHSLAMEWMLPGVAPTGKRVEVPMVVVAEFRDGKLAHERVYWDRACVLVQLGMMEGAALPVAGAEAARKVLHLP
jgi:carboxymethylenebutenolidase